MKQFLSQHGVISLTCPGACRCRKCQLWCHRAQVLTSLQWSEELEALERLSAALICFQDCLWLGMSHFSGCWRGGNFQSIQSALCASWEDMGQFFLYNFVACRHWPIKMIGRNSPQLTSCLEIFHMYKEAVTFAVTRHFTALSGALSMKKCRRANVFKLPSSGFPEHCVCPVYDLVVICGRHTKHESWTFAAQLLKLTLSVRSTA